MMQIPLGKKMTNFKCKPPENRLNLPGRGSVKQSSKMQAYRAYGAAHFYVALPGGPGDSRGHAAPDRIPSILPVVPGDRGRTAALDPQPAGQGPGVSADPAPSSVPA